MQIKTIMHWRAPYGGASWIGVGVTHSGLKVGEVINEECACTDTCLLTIELEENERSRFCEEMFVKGLFEIGVKEELTISAVEAEPTNYRKDK